MRRLTRSILTASLVAGIASGGLGCTSEVVDLPAEPADESPTQAPVSGTPYFSGALEVRVVAGRPLYSQRGCPTEAPVDEVCDEGIGRKYRLVDDGRLLTLVKAETQVVDGGLSWTAWFRFDKPSRRLLIEQREHARSLGARLLVTTVPEPGDPTTPPRLLVAADVPSVEGRVITLTRLRKPQAWQLVRRVVEAD